MRTVTQQTSARRILKPPCGAKYHRQGRKPLYVDKNNPSPRSVATRPTDGYSVGREPGAG